MSFKKNVLFYLGRRSTLFEHKLLTGPNEPKGSPVQEALCE
uniref:Uncharacterized protein n=1 Tax=viral metagenome TaxID=1070528 RepID=A0A6C0AFC5_9ZZZZ